MEIRYFGHSHFYIKGDSYSIILDPFSNIGLKEFTLKSDYVFCSHSHFDHNNVGLAVGAKLVTNSNAFAVISTYHDEKMGTLRGKNDALLFNLDGYKLAFLGDLGDYDDEKLINKLLGIDILFIPVGGKYTIDAVGALEYIKKIKPKTAVPMHYHIKNSTVDIKPVQSFTSLLGEYKTVKSPYRYGGETGVVVIASEQGESV